jgi:hypothetical protein
MLLLQKVNAQIIEYNAQGTLAAIGCKYGVILIFDMLSKVIVRHLSLYHIDDSMAYAANTDADYFSMYRANFVYVEDDFVF